MNMNSATRRHALLMLHLLISGLLGAECGCGSRQQPPVAPGETVATTPRPNERGDKRPVTAATDYRLKGVVRKVEQRSA